MKDHMMYKAKLTDSLEWVRGYYVHLSSYGGVRENHRLYSGMAETDTDNDGVHFYPEWEEIDPKTLCMSSGVYDKNGNEIFEGDIIRADNGHVGWVVFEGGCFAKKCKCHPDHLNFIYDADQTVIGNICVDDIDKMMKETK